VSETNQLVYEQRPMFSGVTRAENRPNDRGRERDLAKEQIDKKVEGGGTVLNADNIRVVYSPFSLAGGQHVITSWSRRLLLDVSNRGRGGEIRTVPRRHRVHNAVYRTRARWGGNGLIPARDMLMCGMGERWAATGGRVVRSDLAVRSPSGRRVLVG